MTGTSWRPELTCLRLRVVSGHQVKAIQGAPGPYRLLTGIRPNALDCLLVSKGYHVTGGPRYGSPVLWVLRHTRLSILHPATNNFLLGVRMALSIVLPLS